MKTLTFYDASDSADTEISYIQFHIVNEMCLFEDPQDKELRFAKGEKLFKITVTVEGV